MSGKKGFFLILLGLVLAGQFLFFKCKLDSTKKTLSSKIKRCRRAQKALTFSLVKADCLPFSFPQELEKVPYADDSVISKVQQIHVRDVFAPYNACLIEDEKEGYRLFFRYDQVTQMHLNAFNRNIGCIELDQNFNQTERQLVKIDTQSNNSEDPRVLKSGEKVFLIYNDFHDQNSSERKMHIAKIDSNSLETKQITKLDYHKSQIEKNWVPFAYGDTVHFEYQIFNPRSILRLDDPSHTRVTQIQNPQKSDTMGWEEKWGKPLGGSSARLIDGQYLAFFHSKFMDRNGCFWYVMGAYTFSSEPPFQVTAISKEPLLFHEIYQTKPMNTADPNKHVIFPGGYAIAKDRNRTLLHLACGENDCAIKIVTFDKDKLLSSLVPIQ